MNRKQAILKEVQTARDEARLRMQTFSLQDLERFFDLEAALETLEHRLVGGSENVTEATLLKAQELASSLSFLRGSDAA